MFGARRFLSTISAQEVQKFSKLSGDWWNLDGPFKALHKLNPVRVQFIEEKATIHFQCKDLTGLRFADVGCGGGILAEVARVWVFCC